jgi:transcriptional regulator with XRE-family HTH domain
MNKVLGDRLLELLKDRKMTQREFAAKLGMGESVVSRYLSGNREPKIELLSEMARILNTTTDYLVGNECGNEEFYFPKIKRMLARNAKEMTMEDKRELIDVLLGGN